MRILGIDIGKTGVKAVEIDTAFGRYELHEYHDRPIVPGTDPREAVRELVQSLPKPADRVIVAMRSSQTTFRNLQLPTRDKKAIQASVGFELEDELPFAIEDSIYDYTVLSQVGSLSHVHVASTLDRHVRSSLETWSGTGVEPDVLTTEAWAYRSLLSRVVDANLETPVLLAQLGHERSILYVHWKGLPVVAREIKWGGADLTLAICRKYSVPLEQAESAKLDHGFVLPETQRAQATQEQVEFSDTLLEAITPLLRDIRQAELTCKSVTQQTIGRIYLCGGTSLLPGLGKRLAEELRIPVQPLRALTSVSHSGVDYSEETDAKFALAAALAITQVGPGRGAIINLRRGEFAKQGANGDVGFEQLKGPLTALSAIASCVLISFIVQASVYQARLKETNAQLERSIKTFFGGLPPSVVRNYMNSTATLKRQVNAELGKQREMSKLMTANPKSPLEFLRELSASVPKDVVVDITKFQVGAAPAQPYAPDEEVQASLTVVVANPQMAERLSGILDGKLAGLQRSKTEEVPGVAGGPKRWKVTFSGKPKEEAYGK